MYGFATTAAAALLGASVANGLTLSVANGTAGYTNYNTVTGYFLQDDAGTNASTFSYVCVHP